MVRWYRIGKDGASSYCGCESAREVRSGNAAGRRLRRVTCPRIEDIPVSTEGPVCSPALTEGSPQEAQENNRQDGVPHSCPLSQILTDVTEDVPVAVFRCRFGKRSYN